MPAKRFIFSDSILDEYMAMHQHIIELKFAYLTLVQLASVSTADKQTNKDLVEHLSNEINTHFVGLLAKDINTYNVADFERQEQTFLSSTRREIVHLQKRINRISPVKINPEEGAVVEQRIDIMLQESNVYDAPALSKAHIDGLGRFSRYLLDYVYTDDSSPAPAKKNTTPVEKELLTMKITVYRERFQGGNSENLDILYKMIAKFESLLSSRQSISVHGPCPLETEVEVAAESIIVSYDDLYNLRLLYRTDSVLLELFIKLAESVTSHGILYQGQIYGATTASGSSATVFLADPATVSTPMTVDMYRKTYQDFLERAELRNIYGSCLSRISSKQHEHEQREAMAQEAARESVSSALDDLL